jgi:Membrane bound beta barrel domain (DUF5777)
MFYQQIIPNKMKIKTLFTSLLVFCFFGLASAQDDLLKQLDTVKSTENQIETSAFKGLQICNMQSTKMPAKNEWYVLVSHRFGDLSQGLDNFFGLDQAYTKIGAIYGPTDWLSLGFSRQTFQKTYELAVKYKLADQIADGFPVAIVGYNTMDIRSDLKKDGNPGLQFNNRLAYTTQLLISRKFSDKFSLQIAPVFVHKNLYEPLFENKNQFLITGGGRMKISKRMSINLEYASKVGRPQYEKYNNVLTAGLDIETGGHVFQMVFSNSQAMNDVAVFTNADGVWAKGKGIYFGFNMYRVF